MDRGGKNHREWLIPASAINVSSVQITVFDSGASELNTARAGSSVDLYKSSCDQFGLDPLNGAGCDPELDGNFSHPGIALS